MTTPSQTVGPFFAEALPFAEGHALVPADHPGAVVLSGRVLDGAGAPVPDALLEIWQAGVDGGFASDPGIFRRAVAFRGFGRAATDSSGRYWFRTVKPAPVPTVDGRAQAPHIAVSVFARGLLHRAATRIYFPDEAEANAADPLLASLEPDRAATLVARADGDELVFDVHLQGATETVFLDLSAIDG